MLSLPSRYWSPASVSGTVGRWRAGGRPPRLGRVGLSARKAAEQSHGLGDHTASALGNVTPINPSGIGSSWCGAAYIAKFSVDTTLNELK